MIKRVRNVRYILILCLVLVASCSPAAETGIGKPTESFLWEVSSDVNTIYILGSVHVARADLYPLNDAIEDAYDDSQNIVVEVNVSEISDQEMAELLMEKGMYPSGNSLEVNIPAELYFRLSERIAKFDPSGFLLSYMNLFEPWVVAITISELDYSELGYDAEDGIDMHFINEAKDDGKNILELESAEFQLELFDSLSDELQVVMLEDAIDNPVTEEIMDGVFNAWSMGDVMEMEQLLFEGIEEHPEYQSLNAKIVDERNFTMVNKIEGFLEGDIVHFVIVGAGHLVGENGIINLLVEKGYEINQL